MLFQLVSCHRLICRVRVLCVHDAGTMHNKLTSSTFTRQPRFAPVDRGTGLREGSRHCNVKLSAPLQPSYAAAG